MQTQAANQPLRSSDVFGNADIAANQKFLELLSIDGFLVNKHLGELIEHRAVVDQNLGGTLVGNGDQFRDFLVDGGCGVFREITLSSDIAAWNMPPWERPRATGPSLSLMPKRVII